MNYKSQVTWKETDLVKGGMSGKKTLPDQIYQILNASHLPSWLSLLQSDSRSTPIPGPVRQNPTV